MEINLEYDDALTIADKKRLEVADLLADIKEKKEFTADLDARMKGALEEFDGIFQPAVSAS